MTATIPSATDPRWSKLILGQLQPDFLGARVLVGRLTASYSMDPTPATMTACCLELHGFYTKLAHLPKIQAEIAKLFP